MPNYVVPTFNLQCNVWSIGSPGGAPRVTLPCNLAYGRRVYVQYWNWGEPPANNVAAIYTYLLVPAFSDVRDWACTGGADYIECPGGSGRFYYVDFVDDIGKGFPNEHRLIVMEKTTGQGAWPTPIP